MIPAVTKHRVSHVNAVLLMHFDGTNGSTTFTDVYGTVFAGIAGATISTAQFEFGGASATQSSTAGICNNTAGPTIFDFRSGDFTIECWIRPQGSPTAGIFSTSSTHGCAMGLFGTSMFFGSGAGPNATRTVSISTGVWAAVAWVRSSGTSQLYVNGTATGATLNDTNDYHPSLSAGFTTNIGLDSQISGAGTVSGGFIDELRISNVARYTSNYTPSGPFTF